MAKKTETGLRRNGTDKFYTRKHIVKLCYDSIRSHININRRSDLIIEPSAGNGAFINSIKKLCNNYIFLDIKPEHKEIFKANYLKFDSNKLVKIFCSTFPSERGYPKIHVIGNPPFGSHSTLAIKFIKKSCEFCDTFSFVLPNNFRKETLKRHVPLNFHLVYQKTLPKNAFKIGEKCHNVKCIFQIWEKRKKKRRCPKTLEPIGFIFCKKMGRWNPLERPDIAIRNAGGAGKLVPVNEVINRNHHYFIKFVNGKSLRYNLKVISKIKFKNNNTTGVDSITKQELIKAYNKVLNI
jgi:predicted RNA methylase